MKKQKQEQTGQVNFVWALAGGYLIYLGGKLLYSLYRDGADSTPILVVIPAAAVFIGVALGLMLHAHVDAVPAAITVSCAILGMVLVVTRDGWLSLFMAAVVVPDTTLLPLLCIVMLPAWLLLAGRPLMIAKRHTD